MLTFLWCNWQCASLVPKNWVYLTFSQQWKINVETNLTVSVPFIHSIINPVCSCSIKSRVVVQCRIVSCDGFYENRYNNVASKIACIFTLNFQMQTKRLLNIFLIKLNDGVIPSKIVSLVPMMRLQALVFYLQIQHHILTRRDTQFFFTL